MNEITEVNYKFALFEFIVCVLLTLMLNKTKYILIPNDTPILAINF